ncbi:hypothetical protein PYV00_04170 [Novosphingobium sp. H3SJ31-1]|uniref:Uncharacterized protein n=2 Tax=Novosphingobium album (ex Liu et al. 2023) TaxID=3031130 RepID=A0ABT5WLJ8_9SPHN|nr:hypothetical protein [Novosphingobium album (ex Liu et al. 2023)]MDE8650914.1 hypothetical protein [Novosphingobium album (ex Liu et al. 2023)]
MACLMAAVIVAGFSLNLVMGRSTFAVPPIYHVHAFVFFGWIVLYLAQTGLIAANNVALHRRLGVLALLWVPVMVVLGTAMTVVALRRTGGPFFFDQNEFLVSNPLHLLCFAGLVGAALVLRRRTDWHRRLMFVAMAGLTGPGLGRLLPMPLLMPWSWRITIAATTLFPLFGMLADKRRTGRVHPAWYYGIAAIAVTQILADLIAYNDGGIGLTRSVLAGSAGSARPMAAYWP